MEHNQNTRIFGSINFDYFWEFRECVEINKIGRGKV